MPNLGVTSRSLFLTDRGWSVANTSGVGELFSAPCIGCRATVSVTRLGAFTGAQRHSLRQCDALRSGRSSRA